jgi:formylglycine-generating enzyme required for sulfatase activity
VEKVSWKNATNYCAKITVREREAGRLPAGFAYRLPTEAEWEYACRAGTATRYAYGDDPDYGQLGEHAWCSPGSANRTHPVETKKPNAWGLYDMHGNVTEWCLDWYGAFPGGSATNPRGPSEGSYRVIRGGAWNYGGAWRCRSANRDYAWPDTKSNLTGFRPVLAPER